MFNVTPRTLVLVISLLPFASEARDRGASEGSAIQPRVTIERGAMRPGEEGVLVLCLTNEGGTDRDLPTGTVLEWRVSAGELTSSELSPVVDPTNTFSGGDWQYSNTADLARLVFVGAPRPWPAQAPVCLRMNYVAPSGSTTMVGSIDVHPSGAVLAPAPAVLALVVDSGIQIAGPTGATGPQGPEGPQGPTGETGARGPAGVGARVSVMSTDWELAGPCDPAPRPVPGLDAEITIEESSQLHVELDLLAFRRCPPFMGSGSRDWYPATIELELDGTVVDSFRSFNEEVSFGSHPTNAAYSHSRTWLSPALAAGPHRVRVLVYFNEPAGRSCFQDSTMCFGGASGDLTSRLTLLELRN